MINTIFITTIIILIIIMVIIMMVVIRGDGSSCLPWKVEHRAGKGRVLVASRLSLDDEMMLMVMMTVMMVMVMVMMVMMVMMVIR